MSEEPSDGFKQRARGRRSTLDQDVDRRSNAAAAGAPAVGKHTLTEGWSAGYTALDAIVSFERSLGEARAQIAALARAVAAGDRVAAVTAAYSLRRSLRTARDHLGNIAAPGLADRHEQLAELEVQAGHALGEASTAGLVPLDAAGAGGAQRRDGLGSPFESPPRGIDEGPAASPPGLPFLDLRGLQQRREAAQQLAERAASALGIPPAPVRIDGHARARTEAHRTIAVMAGGAILLHPERFDPARADALETVAHEMVHVAQLGIDSTRADERGDGDAEAEASEIAAQIAAGIEPDRPTVRLAAAEAADGGKKPAPKPRTETPSGMVNARRYLELNAYRIGEVTAQHLVQQRLPQPHPRLAWRNEKLFYQKLFYGLSGILKFQSPQDVAQLLAPCDPYGTVDQLRPLTKTVEAPDSKDDMKGGPVGPWTWSAPVGLAIAQLVEQALIDSLYRLGPRYLALAEILTSDGAAVNPADITRSHPMDRFTVGPMCQPGVFAVIAEGKPRTKQPAARLDPKRSVTLTWVGRQDKELWNWVRASPADATVEEVSAALFEYMTTHDREARADYYATFLTAAPPMFGIPPQWAKTFEETRDFRPAQIPGADTDPDHQIIALGGSTQADAQALAEIAAAPPDPKAKTQPHPPNEHDNLVADATAQATALKGMLAGWKLGSAADKTLAFLARRRAGGADGAKWLPVLSAQRENLTRIGSGILQLNAAVDQMKLSRTGEQAAPLREIMRFYADATACAHLNRSCNRLILRAANAQTSLTARGLGASLRDMDMSVDMMRSGVAEKDYDRRQLSNTALRLREQATAMQTRMMRGGNVPAEEVEDLQIRVEEAALDAKLIAVEFSLRQLSSAAEEAGAGLAAWFASRFSGKFRGLHDATNKIYGQISDIRHEWNKAKHYADMPDDNAEVHTNANLRKAVQAARQRFAELAKREDINEFLREGASIVKWQQFRTACVKLAALIGISLVGSVVGGMVARGAASMMMGTGGAAAMQNLSLGGAIVARGAGLVTETVIQSAGQSLIFGDKLGVAFLENLIMNLGSMGVLKALGSKVEEAARLEKATQSFWQKGAAAGKVVIKQTAAITGHAIMGAAMGYVAHKIVTGKAQPSPATLEEWLMQGAGIAVGRYAGKALEASHARQKQLKLQGHAPSMKLAAETEKLAALAKRVEADPQAKDAMELLQKRHEILTEELKVLEDIAKSPELMKQSGLDQKQLASARAAIKHQLADVHSQGFGDVPLHLAGMRELIPGVLWSGTEKQISAAIHTARESGINIKAKPDPQGGKWHLEIEGRKIAVEQRFEGREKPYETKDIGAHPVPGSRFTGIRGKGEPKPTFTEHDIAPLTAGAAEILNVGETGFRNAISMGDNRLLITNGSKQIRAKVAIGEPMQQVATHDYKPGAKEVTITISKEANPHDIMRATAHEIAEIQTLLVDPNAVGSDALVKGSTSDKLSAHDEGRLAELRVLLYELDNVPSTARRAEIKNEIDKLLDHVGLDKQKVTTDERAKRVLGPELTKRVDQLAGKRLKITSTQVHVRAPDPRNGHWSFYIEADIPGRKEPRLLAQGGVGVDANGAPRGGPSFNIDKRVEHGGSEHRIDIEGIPSLTDYALTEGSKAYEKRFGHPPAELPGSLGDDNKAIFQRAYIAEINKGVDPKTAEKLAAAETPFAQARARLGYKDLDVKVLATDTILMGVPPQMHTVPVKVHVTARKIK